MGRIFKEFEMETKECRSCGEEKRLEEFGKDKNKKDGLKIYCKMCANQRMSGKQKDFEILG